MKTSPRVFPLFWVLLVFIFLWGCLQHEPFVRGAAQGILNASTHEYFQGSVRLKQVSFDRNFRIRIQGFQAALQGEKGDFPVEIRQVESRGPLWGLFGGKGVIFDFKNAKPAHSQQKGLEGSLQLKAGPHWFSKVEARVESLDVGDLAWFNPETLTGAQGQMHGELVLASNFRKESTFEGWVLVDEPGGRVGAHLFDAFLPYLPQLTDKAKMQELSSRSSLVDYRDARLEMNLPDPDRMKVFFHILVPDYNFNLNLHVEVRMDEENAFSKLIQIMGLVKIR